MRCVIASGQELKVKDSAMMVSIMSSNRSRRRNTYVRKPGAATMTTGLKSLKVMRKECSWRTVLGSKKQNT